MSGVNGLKQTVLLLVATEYAITEGSETNEGVSIWYLPVEMTSADTKTKKGVEPIKSILPRVQWNAIKDHPLPGVYEMTMGLGTVKNGRGNAVQAIVPTHAEHIADVDLLDVIESAIKERPQGYAALSSKIATSNGTPNGNGSTPSAASLAGTGAK